MYIQVSHRSHVACTASFLGNWVFYICTHSQTKEMLVVFMWKSKPHKATVLLLISHVCVCVYRSFRSLSATMLSASNSPLYILRCISIWISKTANDFRPKSFRSIFWHVSSSSSFHSNIWNLHFSMCFFFIHTSFLSKLVFIKSTWKNQNEKKIENENKSVIFVTTFARMIRCMENMAVKWIEKRFSVFSYVCNIYLSLFFYYANLTGCPLKQTTQIRHVIMNMN